jgi:glycosyltransferase involved in cell wall biosynthesis
MHEYNPIVSVIVATYGHEDYIRKALDSILMQKVNFKYEVLVGEDCSPDNTRCILKEYEKKHPDKFIMIYRDHNIGARKNSRDLYKRSRGKYLATLEGDDYWTCDNKLQKQVDYLEKHPDIIATAHRVKVVDKHGEKTDKQYPECKDSWYTLKHYQNGILPGHTSSIVRRNVYRDKLYDMSIMEKISHQMPGDRVTVFLLAAHGKIYCFQEVMSAYRYVVDSGTSFSAMQRKAHIDNHMSRIKYYRTIMEHCHNFIDNKEAIETIESIYLWQTIVGCLRQHDQISWNYVKMAWKSIYNQKEALKYVGYKTLLIPKKYIDRKKGMLGT